MRSIVWGSKGSEGSLFLEALGRRGIDTVLHITDGVREGNIFSYFNLHDFHFDYHTLGRDFYRTREALQPQKNRFLDFFSRHFPAYTMALHDYYDAFEVMLRKCYHLLTSLEVDLVIFFNVPHEGADWLFYSLAREMGKKTVFFYQTLVPNRQFVLSTMADYEDLWSLQRLGDSAGPKLIQGSQDSLFYMTNLPASRPPVRRKRIFRRVFLKLGFDRFLRISPDLARDRAEQYRSALQQLQLSPEVTARLQQTNHVYFPLAMQPEMTTSAIGGGFEDQVAALEALREWIPSDWKILVKENPKQTCQQRGPAFFRRLKAIPGLHIVAPSASTFDLIRSSKLVSVVTGTAGWEALRFGKPVLVFGHAWYKGLPGVFRYQETESWQDTGAFRFDLDTLQAGFDSLLCRADFGISDLAYRAIYPEYRAETNAELLAESVDRAIKGW